jgi:hypothetical protein
MTNEEIRAKVAEEIGRLGETRESMLSRLREVGAVPESGRSHACLFAAHFRRVIPDVPFTVGFTSVVWRDRKHACWLPPAAGELIKEFLDAIHDDGIPPEEFVARAMEEGR